MLIQPSNNEARRLRALERCNLLDTPPDPRIDAIVRLVAERFNAPMAAFSVVAEDRVWFKAQVGLSVPEVQRDFSICGRVATTESALILEDIRTHEDFADNPLVVNAPHVAFYAGVPVHSTDNFTLGSLCIMDTKPRLFPWDDYELLQKFAGMLEHEIQSN